ncbi:MAG: hypothetical protein P1Q69_01590 [Candidatus Thorarchaeota archaeon]|nr:hypothetical protein [Candidatus Thorarchaeota archaeon]
MIFEIAVLVAIYAFWILTLVNSMVSSEEVSLTISTLPFIITFPIALLVSASAEIWFPGIFMIDILLTAIVGVLIFVRWVMAIVGE